MAAEVLAPDAFHVYVLATGGVAAGLGGLPHVGDCVDPGDRDRVARLLRILCGRLDRSLADGATPCRTVLLVDGLAGFRASLADRERNTEAEMFERLMTDGPAYGVSLIVTSDHPAAVPGSLLARTTERWVLRLADRHDALLVGVDPTLVGNTAPPGRSVSAASGLVMQVGIDRDPHATSRAISRRWSTHSAGRPEPVPALPTRVGADCVAGASRLGADGVVRLACGLDAATLRPVALHLGAGDHALVAGPARSGRSNALTLLGTQWLAARPGGWVGIACCHHAGSVEIAEARVRAGIEDVLAAAPTDGTPALILIDDAEWFDDPSGVINDTLARAGGNLSIIAAARTDALRASYSHWTAVVRRQRRGLLLGTTHELDGDLLGVLLPRNTGAHRCASGRGWLIGDGEVTRTLIAQAD